MVKKEKQAEKRVFVPSSIFQDRDLAPLESISEYLKEEKGLSYHEIAELLKRDDRTIWTCCYRAKKKREKKADKKKKSVKVKKAKSLVSSAPSVEEMEDIPLDIFHNRDLAPLEGISKYLKENADKSLHEIAVLLNRDDRTIWTCYNRAQKKLGLKEGG